jgi:hypothetical protein
MATMSNVSIDVDKITKDSIRTTESGKRFLDVTIAVNDELRMGNDVSIWIAQTKEQSKAKERKTFLGNGLTFWRNDGKEVHRRGSKTEQKPEGDKSDLPF